MTSERTSVDQLLGTIVPEAIRDTTGQNGTLPAGGQWIQPFSLANLHRAEEHYARRGYTQRAVPWIVSAASYCATKPDEAIAYETIDGFLVASAEQSFLQLLLQGEQIGRAQALTPCFRNEVHDSLHLPYFMKLELVDTQNVSIDGVGRMLTDALDFYSALLPVEAVAVPGGSIDIVTQETGTELGSYGIRTMIYQGRELAWVYGTGCAEPRLTQALAGA